MSVIVFGSINMDLVARTPRLPSAGETLIGHSFATVPGGKGANQAVAVARLGLPTQMVGRVGGDQVGQELLAGLIQSGVDCSDILVDQTTHSGVAMIAVDDASENTIIIIPGANGRVGEADVERLTARLSQGSDAFPDILPVPGIAPSVKILLLQLEVPITAVVAAAKAARQADVTVLLDPAPAMDLPTELYGLIDIITPNQVEAGQLVGFPVDDLATAQQASEVLHRRGVGTVIVKLGSQGALCSTAFGLTFYGLSSYEIEIFEVPAFPVHAVDTVAAGDAFNGGLAAGLAVGLTLKQATRQASAVAALSVTQAGAQPSLPTRAALDRFLSPEY